MHVQAKLLRTLQERTIERVGGRELLRLDVRVVSAANVDLRDAAKRGAFRTDLYYRLAEATICPPPLRERAGDVRRLAAFFVERYASRFGVAVRGVSPEALARLEAHAWPGNVRELEAVIKVAVVLAQDMVHPEHLPKWIAAPEPRAEGWLPAPPPHEDRAPGAPTAPADPRRLHIELDLPLDGQPIDLKALTAEAADQAERAILAAMVRRGHSQAKLAKILDVDPKTLRGKLRKYGLESGSE
jgi:DNA-binding NtrC family response regulator